MRVAYINVCLSGDEAENEAVDLPVIYEKHCKLSKSKVFLFSGI